MMTETVPPAVSAATSVLAPAMISRTALEAASAAFLAVALTESAAARVRCAFPAACMAACTDTCLPPVAGVEVIRRVDVRIRILVGFTGEGRPLGCWWALFPYCVCVSAQSCLAVCNSMDCSLPGSSVHGIFQARVPSLSEILFQHVFNLNKLLKYMSSLKKKRLNLPDLVCIL